MVETEPGLVEAESLKLSDGQASGLDDRLSSLSILSWIDSSANCCIISILAFVLHVPFAEYHPRDAESMCVCS